MSLSALPLGRQAKHLMEKYAPTAKLALVFGGGGHWNSYSHKPRYLSGACEIKWRPSGGITTLLHEMGHVVLRHNDNMPLLRAQFSKAEDWLQEARAWRWAERIAIRERLLFDYQIAEDCFRTYTPAVTVAWRKHPPSPHPTDSHR